MVNLEFYQWPFINLHYPTAGQGYAKSGSYFRIAFCTFFLHLCEVGATLAQASDIPVLGGMFHVVIVKASHVLVPAKSHPPTLKLKPHFLVQANFQQFAWEKTDQVVPEALMLPLPGGFRLHQKVVALYELLLNSEMKVPLGSMDGSPNGEWGVLWGGEWEGDLCQNCQNWGGRLWEDVCISIIYVCIYIYILSYCIDTYILCIQYKCSVFFKIPKMFGRNLE